MIPSWFFIVRGVSPGGRSSRPSTPRGQQRAPQDDPPAGRTGSRTLAPAGVPLLMAAMGTTLASVLSVSGTRSGPLWPSPRQPRLLGSVTARWLYFSPAAAPTGVPLPLPFLPFMTHCPRATAFVFTRQPPDLALAPPLPATAAPPAPAAWGPSLGDPHGSARRLVLGQLSRAHPAPESHGALVQEAEAPPDPGDQLAHGFWVCTLFCAVLGVVWGDSGSPYF
ncbi:uncharacterized protein LOC119528119 [Choloepus didactylus]|uniref:uncharacterized protein LOC119528119 n=1 Tax=Choloepus didactylus TaxID=27675 RepID=UPI00189DC203|nr:uncharacterized protein LOC119528119 [Choloepus didactylus]